MKTKIIYKKRQKTIAQLKKDLTKAFNRYIRFRDSVDGYISCISCSKQVPVKEAHAGHYLASTYSATRFSEANVNAQCSGCNLFKRGNLVEYRINLAQKIGEEQVQALEARRHDLWKPSREELEELIKYYNSLYTQE